MARTRKSKVMRYRILLAGSLFCVELLTFGSLSSAASGSQKVKIGYPAFTGAYTPLWIAVAEGLGSKYGLDLEAIYGGRTSPALLLENGEVQYTVQTGFGTVQSYARGMKDHVIIASFANTTGFSIYSKPQITKAADLRGNSVGHVVRRIPTSLDRGSSRNRRAVFRKAGRKWRCALAA
jgi:ABC-type nitrate/sulfonate/bicarbonate transport system substrate-binding protein